MRANHGHGVPLSRRRHSAIQTAGQGKAMETPGGRGEYRDRRQTAAPSFRSSEASAASALPATGRREAGNLRRRFLRFTLWTLRRMIAFGDTANLLKLPSAVKTSIFVDGHGSFLLDATGRTGVTAAGHRPARAFANACPRRHWAIMGAHASHRREIGTRRAGRRKPC